jgi:pimeloyl-ACP methyl ester carboxylesterase
MSIGAPGASRPKAQTATSPDGIPIRFEVTGAGKRAIVFVHGWSCDRTYWRHQVGAFADAYRVVSIDLAGHGESGDGRTAWTMPAFGSDVVAVVEQLALPDAVLVGHSMGGDVIAEAALTLGDRVAGLVLVDTYSRLTEPKTGDEIEAFVTPFRSDFVGATRSLVHDMFPATTPRDLIDAIAEDMSSAPPDVALDALRHAIGNDGPIMVALRRITVPVVAINPDYRATDAESLRRHGVETVIATGVGHFLMLEDPEQFNRLLGEAITTRM